MKASEGTLAVYVGDGEGGLTLDQNYFLGVFPLAIDLGDLDGDGDLDAISSHLGSGRFEVHESRGMASCPAFRSRLRLQLRPLLPSISAFLLTPDFGSHGAEGKKHNRMLGQTRIAPLALAPAHRLRLALERRSTR